MGNPINLTGRNHGRWTVIESTRLAGKKAWVCQCSCGNIKIRLTSGVLNPRSLSCGCARGELIADRNRENAIHGMSDTGVHKAWSYMLTRCVRDERLFVMGGSHVGVCGRWKLSFGAFYFDMGLRPEGYNLRRIDNALAYGPSNCLWVDDKHHARNRRSNRHITWDGVTKNLCEWSEETGVSLSTISKRIDILKWDVGKALSATVRKNISCE